MNFINKEHISMAEVGENGSQVSGPFDSRPGCYANADAQFPGNNVRQGCFAKTGRSVKQNVIKRFLALQGRPDVDSQFFLNLLLADILLQGARPEADFNLGVIVWLKLG